MEARLDLARLIGLKRGPRPLSWEDVRRKTPIRNSFAETDTEGDRLLVSAPIDSRAGFAGRLAKSLGRSDSKSYELDSVGAFVWNLIDGHHNVEAISHALQSKYRISRLEAEVSLVEFLRLMELRGLIEWCYKGAKAPSGITKP